MREHSAEISHYTFYDRVFTHSGHISAIHRISRERPLLRFFEIISSFSIAATQTVPSYACFRPSTVISESKRDHLTLNGIRIGFVDDYAFRRRLGWLAVVNCLLNRPTLRPIAHRGAVGIYPRS